MIQLLHGDCLEIMRGLPTGSVDAVVTDPPGALHFMGRAWDHDRGGREQWIEWLTERLAAALRVARPGAYALIWAIPRTSHWTGTAIEDAGWEVRDVITALNGQGFPKSLNVSRDLLSLPWCACGGCEETAARTIDVPVQVEGFAASNADLLVADDRLGSHPRESSIDSLAPLQGVGAGDGTAAVLMSGNRDAANGARGFGPELRSGARHRHPAVNGRVKNQIGQCDPVMFGAPDVAVVTSGDEVGHDVGRVQVKPESLWDQVMGDEVIPATAVDTGVIAGDDGSGDTLPVSALVRPAPAPPSGIIGPGHPTPIVDGHAVPGTVAGQRTIASESSGEDGSTDDTSELIGAALEPGAAGTAEGDGLGGCVASARAERCTLLAGRELDPTVLAGFGKHASIIRSLVAENKVSVCVECGRPERPEWVHEGLGTALKPAAEFWFLARKPLAASNVAENVIRHGTGALNIDGCRLKYDTSEDDTTRAPVPTKGWCINSPTSGSMNDSALAGRWPPNVALVHSPGCVEVGVRRVKGSHDGGKPIPQNNHDSYSMGWSGGIAGNGYADPDGRETVAEFRCVDGCPVAELDRQSGTRKSGGSNGRRSNGVLKYGGVNGRPSHDTARIETTDGLPPSEGGASRFFATFGYFPKASRRDRGEGNKHPCVKSQPLMRWLCKLVTPKGGTILDPFMGSGSTGVAALAEGFSFVGIEQERESYDTAKRRLKAAQAKVSLFA